MIRKTMLDECKGDRFEELLSNFALVVLQHSLEGHSHRKVVRAPTWNDHSDAQRLVPLVIAHRLSLQSRLTQRRSLEQAARHEVQEVAQKQTVLNDRKARALHQPNGASRKDVKTAVDSFRSSFTAGSEWVQFVVHGGGMVAAAQDLETTSAFEDLANSLKHHRAELSQWEDFHSSLPVQEAVENQTNSAQPGSAPLLVFDKHEKSSSSIQKVDKEGPSGEEEDPTSVYSDILQRMQTELHARQETVVKTGPRSAATPFKQQSRDSTGPRSDNDGQVEQSLPPAAAAEVLISSAPVFTALIEPPQSPVAKSPIQPDEMDTSWLDESPSRQISADMSNVPVAKRGEAAGVQDARSETARAFLEQQTPEQSRRRSSSEQLPDPLSSEDRMGLASIEHPDQDPKSELFRQRPVTSLLERTRQSMSLATIAQERKAGMKKAKSTRLAQFPVNPLETPRKGGQRDAPLSATSGDSTPREQLFSDEADYASVFKTRPKIALSPMISPDRSQFEDSILGHHMNKLNMADSSD